MSTISEYGNAMALRDLEAREIAMEAWAVEERHHIRRRHERAFSALDASEIACSDELVVLLNEGNPNAIGRWMLAARDRYIDSAVDWEMKL